MAANANGAPEPDGEQAPTWDDSGLSYQYEDLTQLATRRLSALANALVEALRAQPVVGAAIIAAGVGVLIGVSLARRPKSRTEAVRDQVAERFEDVGRQARRTGARAGRLVDYGELMPLAMKLLENPIVRTYVLRAAARMVAKRFK